VIKDFMLVCLSKEDWEGVVGSSMLEELSRVDVSSFEGLVVEPGTYDSEGNVLVPHVVDGKFYVNLRLSGEILTLESDSGKPYLEVFLESLTKDPSIILVDPNKVETPERVWL